MEEMENETIKTTIELVLISDCQFTFLVATMLLSAPKNVSKSTAPVLLGFFCVWENLPKSKTCKESKLAIIFTRPEMVPRSWARRQLIALISWLITHMALSQSCPSTAGNYVTYNRAWAHITPIRRFTDYWIYEFSFRCLLLHSLFS